MKPWEGSLSLAFERRGARTVLARNRHHGPILVQSPFHPGDGACHVYVLHPPGGLVGGDRLTLDMQAGGATRALLTTPAATKFYRTVGPWARQAQTVRAAPGAAVEWLPQESLYFAGTRAAVRTRVELDPAARFIGWESWCAGRPACGERFDRGALHQALEVFVAHRPVLVERLHLAGGGEALDAPWGLGGFAAAAVAVAYPGGALLDLARDFNRRHAPSPGRAGATVVDDLLVVRALAPGISGLRRWLHGLWAELRPPLLGVEPHPPRIWAT